ncbi:MAG: 5-hydroxyisourate hydrolase [Pseudophaeobacter arcticus]
MFAAKSIVMQENAAHLSRSASEMTGYLTTHVLDTAQGSPAANLPITLYRIDGDSRHKLAQMSTNADGRTDSPILPQDQFTPGTYELVFDTGAYLRASGQAGAEPLFLDQVPIRFGISDAEAHYHVPLLLSPFGYSTYRGS